MLKIKYNKDICEETETIINLVIVENIKGFANFIHLNNLYNNIELEIKFVDNSTCELKIICQDCKIIFEQIAHIAFFIANNNNNAINVFRLKPLKKIKSGKEFEGLFEINKDGYYKI